jgi:asparagine synthase (glutamine-hydrolysing)
MNFNSVTSILTLRYDYTQNHNLPELKWNNLEEKFFFPTEELISNLISNIKQSFPKDYSKPISISLSGGVDSSLMLCLLKKVFPENEINAISIKFADSVDETQSASKIAKKVGVNHHIVEVDNFLEKLPDAIAVTGLPFWDIHWIYLVEASKDYSNYLVSGDGGDELFGGYTFRYSKFLSKISSNSTVHDKIIAYLSCHERDHVPNQENIFEKKLKFDWNNIYDNLTPFFNNSLSPIDQVFLADYNGKLLYNFSIINNKIAKNYDVIPVTPMLSPNIIYKSMKMPTEEKYNSNLNLGKLPLRKILKQFGIEDLILKQKLGFSVNTENLWKNYGFDMVKDYLTDGKIIQDGLIRKDWIQSNLHRENIDVRHINKFLGLLAFEIWYRNNNL